MFTRRSNLLIQALAAILSTAGSAAAYAQAPATSTDQAAAPQAATPAASVTVTTTGGSANKLAKFSGSSTIANSILYDNGSEVGIGTTSPTATLTVTGTTQVNGSATQNGALSFPPVGTGVTSKGYSSQPLKFTASAYDSASSSATSPHFQIQAEATGNDTSAPNGTLNILASSTSSTAVETGLYINSNGTIHFAPGQTFASTAGAFCVASSGGFGSGGTSFVAPEFAVPAAGKCTPWSGFTKTASTVVLMTSGVACLSTDQKKLTVSVSSADPNYFGAGATNADYIQLTRTGTTGSFTTGTDTGYFSGSAAQQTCTTTLLQLNEIND